MSKKTKSELRISTFSDKQILFAIPKDGTVTLTKALWERTRRNPQYLKICDGIEFNDTGIVKSSWYVYGHPENQKLLEKRKQVQTLFGITQLLNPKKAYEELLPVIHLVWVAPVPIEAIAMSQEGPERFIEGGKYVTLKIDITQKDKHIFESLQRYLNFYRQFTGKVSGRNHAAKETESYYRVWDERLELVPFPKIAYKLRIGEETAKKQFRRAFELILDREYNKTDWKDLVTEKLVREKRYEKLSNYEETKQQEKLITSQEELEMFEATPSGVSSFFSDDIPEALQSLYLQDIHKELCQTCPDVKCRSDFESGNFDVVKDCPRVIAFLQS